MKNRICLKYKDQNKNAIISSSSNARTIATNAFDKDSRLKNLLLQLKEIKTVENFGMGLIEIGDALSFAGVGGSILFSKKVIKKINEHGISDEQLVSVFKDINNKVVLGFDYVDNKGIIGISRKGFVLENYDSVIYILGIKNSVYNSVEVETLSTLYQKDNIKKFIMIHGINNLYINKKSSDFLDRILLSTESLPSSTTTNNISNKSLYVKHGKQINYNNYVKRTSRITLTAMCLAIGIMLPQVTHFLPEVANKFSLMHIPTYVAGIICGPLYGLFVGIFSPLFSMLFFNMPKVPTVYSMMIELGSYGLFAGLLSMLIRTKFELFNIYSSLIISMIIGKIIYGVCNALIFKAGVYSFAIWISAAFINGILGIILHLIVIPPICLLFKKKNQL